MSESLAAVVQRFVAHKRALARKYESERHEFRPLVRFTDERGVATLDALTPALLEDFLSSRPRRRPRSFNHLLGVVRCLLDWAVNQELLGVSPLRVRRRRATASRIPVPVRRKPGAPAPRSRGGPAGQQPGAAPRPHASGDLRALLRTRTARRRGVRAPHRRHRGRARPPRRPRRQVRQEPARPPRAAHGRAPARAARAAASRRPGAGTRRPALQLRWASTRQSEHGERDVPSPRWHARARRPRGGGTAVAP